MPSTFQMPALWRRKRDDMPVSNAAAPRRSFLDNLDDQSPFGASVRQSQVVADSMNRALKQKVTGFVEWIDHTSLEVRSSPTLDRHLQRFGNRNGGNHKPRRKVSNFDLDEDWLTCDL